MILTVNEHGDPIYLSDVEQVQVQGNVLLALHETGKTIGMFKDWHTWTLSPDQEPPVEVQITRGSDPEVVEAELKKMRERMAAAFSPEAVQVSHNQLRAELEAAGVDSDTVAMLTPLATQSPQPAQSPTEELQYIHTRILAVVKEREARDREMLAPTDYAVGVVNGLELACSILLNREAKLLTCGTPPLWGADMPVPSDDDLRDEVFQDILGCVKEWRIEAPMYYTGLHHGGPAHVELIRLAIVAGEERREVAQDKAALAAVFGDKVAAEIVVGRQENDPHLNECATSQGGVCDCDALLDEERRRNKPTATDPITEMLDELELEERKPKEPKLKKARNYSHTERSCPFYWIGNATRHSQCICTHPEGEPPLAD